MNERESEKRRHPTFVAKTCIPVTVNEDGFITLVAYRRYNKPEAEKQRIKYETNTNKNQIKHTCINATNVHSFIWKIKRYERQNNHRCDYKETIITKADDKSWHVYLFPSLPVARKTD